MTKSLAQDSERPPTPRMPLAQRRRQLLDAAVTVMSERGVAAASTRAITDAAGVPQGLFHYCFDSRHALLRSLLERESERALAMAASLDPASSSLTDALRRSFEAQLARVSAEPAHFLVLSELTVYARIDPELADLTRNQRRRDLDLVAILLRQWQGERSGLDVDAWARVILAGLDGITEAWLSDRDDQARDQAASLLAEAVGGAACNDHDGA